MTRPTSLPLQDRLRAHYAERSANEPLPGSDTDTALGSLTTAAPAAVRLTGRSVRPLWVAAAAVVVAIGAAAAVAVVRQDDPGVATDDDGRDGPDPTVTVPPSSTTSTTTSTSAPGQGGHALPAGMTLVVGSYGPLGGWDGDSWVREDGWSSVLQATGDEIYSLVRLDELIVARTGRLGEPCAGMGPEGDKPVVDLFDWDNEAGGTGIAVTGFADPRPRPVTIIDAEDPGEPAYLAAIPEVLAQLGVSADAPLLAGIVQADLDGDGTIEMVLTVEGIRNPGSKDVPVGPAVPGDYSVVFVVRPDGSSPAVVQHDITEGSETWLERYRVDALADLNADGRMEIVTHSFSEELHGQEVATYNPDGTVTEVLADGCG